MAFITELLALLKALTDVNGSTARCRYESCHQQELLYLVELYVLSCIFPIRARRVKPEQVFYDLQIDS